MTADEVAKDIVDAALKVQRALGPGLLESAYQACLAHELQRRRHRVECEVAVPLEFEGVLIEVGYRIDMRIDQLVLVENKTVEKILPIHLAQLLTYLKLSGLSLGADHQLERDFVTRRHPAGSQKPSRRTEGRTRIRRLTEVHPLFFACLALLAFRSSSGRRGKPHKVSAHVGAAPGYHPAQISVSL